MIDAVFPDYSYRTRGRGVPVVELLVPFGRNGRSCFKFSQKKENVRNTIHGALSNATLARILFSLYGHEHLKIISRFDHGKQIFERFDQRLAILQRLLVESAQTSNGSNQ